MKPNNAAGKNAFELREVPELISKNALYLVCRLRLRKRDFSIISNNCWGADLYKIAGIPYLTPFVGLFIKPDCYLRLLDDFRTIMKLPLKFKDKSSDEEVNEFRKSEWDFPIGCIGDDIEINFLHYKSREDAAAKWQRRVQRITRDDNQLFVKFCDTNNPTGDQLRHFADLPFSHKVCLVGKQYEGLENTVVIPGFESTGCVENIQHIKSYRKYFDPIDWLNGGPGKRRRNTRAE